MFEYQDYYVNAEDFDYIKMGQLILKEKKEQEYWDSISLIDWLDNFYVLIDFVYNYMSETYNDEVLCDTMYNRLKFEIGKHYEVFVNRFMDDSDALFLCGLLLDVYSFSFSHLGVLNDIDATQKMGTEYIEKSVQMNNPVGIAFIMEDQDKYKTMAQREEKYNEAKKYLDAKFPETFFREEIKGVYLDANNYR